MHLEIDMAEKNLDGILTASVLLAIVCVFCLHHFNRKGQLAKSLLGKVSEDSAQVRQQIKSVEYSEHGAKSWRVWRSIRTRTSFQLAVPRLVAGSALGLLGFGSSGIVAGLCLPFTSLEILYLIACIGSAAASTPPSVRW